MSTTATIPLDADFAGIVRRQREFFASGATRPAQFREEQLDRLASAIEANETRMLAALHADLGRPERDALLEVTLLRGEAKFARKHVRRWMRPERRGIPPMAWPGRAEVRREPFGVACIIGPWNYPFYLVLGPLVAAIAGGNCAVLKPSRSAPESSRVIADLVRETFAPEYVASVEDDRAVGEALLRERFDHIFFTGGTEAGQAVMAAAARHLTPVALELGGKSPCIVCADARIEVAARRIVWGKFLNAGQTCVAPDYVLVDRAVHDRLVGAMCRAVAEFYGPDFGRIVSRRHFERLQPLLRDGAAACGGGCEAERLYIAPTILTGVRADSPVMQEEIFGPILPVLPFDSVDNALSFVRARPAPLALYLFTEDRATQRRLVAETQSGGTCVNDVILHMIGHRVPFGGVGMSGMGAYHGKAGFDTFTQQRTVMRRGTLTDPAIRYPNFKLSLSWARRLYRVLLHE
jgi:acyl-CoA reductase-like NAD-dependent aldehyde dehydrogenase